MSGKTNLDRSQFVIFTVLVLFVFIFSIIIYSGWVSLRYQEQMQIAPQQPAAAQQYYQENMRSLIIFTTFIVVLTTLSTALLLRRMIAMTFDLERTNGELVRLEKFKDELTSLLIHDLKNPLTVVIGSLAMMKGGMMGALTATQQNLVALSKESADRLLVMIMNVLDIARLKQGKLELRPTDNDLSLLLQKMAKEYNEVAAREGKIVVLTGAFAEPLIKVDEGVLERILDNLIGNALKHTAKDKGKIELNAGYDKLKQSVVISVKDNGEGIPAEYLEQIFDEYTQVASRQLGTKIDTGLGLTFCKLAVQAMGGRIWTESKAGSGATFYFTILQ